jgi:hypothetical protein
VAQGREKVSMGWGVRGKGWEMGFNVGTCRDFLLFLGFSAAARGELKAEKLRESGEG